MKTKLRKRSQKTFKKPSLTKQNHKKECDVNNIISSYVKTGTIAHTSSRTARYGDFSGEVDYMQSLNSVIEAQEQFEMLPSSVRERFANNPANLLKFLEDKNNKSEAIQLGIINDDSNDKTLNQKIDTKDQKLENKEKSSKE